MEFEIKTKNFEGISYWRIGTETKKEIFKMMKSIYE